MRNCLTISSRGRDVKKAPCNGPNVSEQKKTLFYALQANKEEIEMKVPVSYCFPVCVVHDTLDGFFSSVGLWGLGGLMDFISSLFSPILFKLEI